jgi:hypothetical protein
MAANLGQLAHSGKGYSPDFFIAFVKRHSRYRLIAAARLQS